MIEDGVKISELNSTTTYTNSDLIPLIQNDETKNITIGNLLSKQDIKGEFTTINFTEKTTTLPSGDWYSLGDLDESVTLEKGTYLALTNATLAPDGSNDGIATIDLYVDGSRQGQPSRNTIPIVHSYTCTANSIMPLLFNNNGSHSFNIHCFGSINYKVTYCSIILVRIK